MSNIEDLVFIESVLSAVKKFREESENPKADYEKLKNFCYQISDSLYNHPMYKFDVYKADIDTITRLLDSIVDTGFAGVSNEWQNHIQAYM